MPTSSEIRAAESACTEAMVAAVLQGEPDAAYTAITAAYDAFAAVIAEVPAGAEKDNATDAATRTRMRAKRRVERDGVAAIKLYPGEYVSLVTDGNEDARMWAVQALGGS